MTNNSNNITEICGRYAKALILSSSGKSDLDGLFDEFKQFNDLIDKSIELRNFINNPLVNSRSKSLTLSQICKKQRSSEVFHGFIKTVSKHGKISLVNKIFKEFKKELDLRDGLTEVSITTSEPLEKKTEELIKNKLSKLLNLKIKFKKKIDKEIIGGVILKVNSIMIDNSIKTKLTSFKI